jgi:hypothetical protein
MIGGYHENQQVDTDSDWPETKEASKAIERRCLGCHQGNLVLPRSLSDERELSFWRPDFIDPRLFLSRHLVFNLSRPEQSLMLLAPLAQNAGGYGLCHALGQDKPVFAGRDDVDYQKIFKLCQAGQRHLEEIRRFDMPNFKPTPAYVREMQRYGVLSADFDLSRSAIDVYQTDQAYWRLVSGYHPAGD